MRPFAFIFQDWEANRSNGKGRMVTVLFRVGQWLTALPVSLRWIGIPYFVFYRVMVEWFLGIELRRTTRVGPGLAMHHGQGLVVNDHTVIGRSCTLRHSTTIGHKASGGGSTIGASVRAGLTLGRSAAVLGLGIIGQFALRCLQAAGAYPVVGIDGVAMRRAAAKAAGADFVLDPAAGDVKQQLADALGVRGAEIVADATGIPDAIPVAMSLACDAGQVVVVGSPRGKASAVNFYDDLHRRYIEVTGAHGNMLFEPAHSRLAGAWGIDKAQRFLLGALASGRLNLAGLVTHDIAPSGLGAAYEGLLKKKEEYLGVTVRWEQP